MGLARSFGELAVLRLVLGAGEAVSPLASMAYIKRNFDEREQGLPTAIYVAGLTLGPAAGALAGTWLLDVTGWRNMFIITGLAGCIWVVPWYLLVRDSGKVRPATTASSTVTASLRGFLRTPVAWGLAGDRYGLFTGGTRVLPRFRVKELGEAFHGAREAIAARRESQAKMRRLAKTIAGHYQDTAFGKPSAEAARVDAVCQPRKRRHPTTGSQPV